jgi:hypothetical protein
MIPISGNIIERSVIEILLSHDDNLIFYLNQTKTKSAFLIKFRKTLVPTLRYWKD